MKSLRIMGETRRIGVSQGYLGLSLSDQLVRIDDVQFIGDTDIQTMIVECSVNGRVPAMISAWEPLPHEVEAIVAGAPVYLEILGRAHPPVSLFVEKIR